ncbi:hypothetical protein ACFVFQ_38590 [Streptomyces sp. NPDC057743]|uniref:hypothetical protein n=1 Tax=Streptomyces sp. NPDC057743 TaxID=3346236 RepID=UPI0036B93C6C
MDRISFTVLLQSAADQVTTAHDIWPDTPGDLIGEIGRTVLDALLPTRHRSRLKARTRKNPTNKYVPHIGAHPATSQNYTVHADITFLEHGLETRQHR